MHKRVEHIISVGVSNDENKIQKHTILPMFVRAHSAKTRYLHIYPGHDKTFSDAPIPRPVSSKTRRPACISTTFYLELCHVSVAEFCPQRQALQVAALLSLYPPTHHFETFRWRVAEHWSLEVLVEEVQDCFQKRLCYWVVSNVCDMRQRRVMHSTRQGYEWHMTWHSV